MTQLAVLTLRRFRLNLWIASFLGNAHNRRFNQDQKELAQMKIEETQKLWMSDVLIPDIFITDYLPLLSSDAVKVYLYAKHVARNRVNLTGTELLAHLTLSEEQFKTALFDLAQHQVISLLSAGDKFLLNDLKEIEFQKQYTAERQPELSEGLKELLNEEHKTELMEQISDTFYHGMMGISQARIIDECLHRFGFEPQTIYALFSEAMAKSKLNQYKYIQGIAEAWHAKGVKSYEDLQTISKRRDEIKRLSRRVGKKLNRNMSEPDEEMVRHWRFDLGYDFSIISLALDKSVKSANPNLNYFNSILEEWEKAGLKTAADVKDYEKSRAAQLALKKSTGAAGRLSKGSFTQRDYEEAEVAKLYEEFSAEELGLAESEGEGVNDAK